MTTNKTNDLKSKKTFGDWLQSIFDAHIKDISDETKRYRNTELKQEISLIGNQHKWARSLMYEFSQIQYALKEKVLSCPHNQEDHKTKTVEWEQCELCGCNRSHKYNADNLINTYYERSYDIMETYKQSLAEGDMKILSDFYNRTCGDMSNQNVWESYNKKMLEIFNKYPIWNDWEF